MLAIMAPSAAYAQKAPAGTEGGHGQNTPEDHCAELRFGDFSKLPEGPGQINLAHVVKGSNGVADYCEVEGYVWQNVRFRVRFPLKAWNGKMVFSGTGGQMGYLQPGDPTVGQERDWMIRGYAVAYDDGGHFSTVSDTKWAANNVSAMLDFGLRASHVATIASKEVLKRFFGREPGDSYFFGCSNSGREALSLAQRFPYDYKGIIAGSPSMDPSDLMGNMFFMAELLRDQSRQGFDLTAANVLHKGVIAQCDKLDRKLDGLLDDPRKCKVDFKPLLCKDGPGDDCLTTHQVDIARQIYDGPRTPDGRQIARSSAFPGSEIEWINFLTPRWVIDYAKEYFQYEGFYPAPGAYFEPKVSELDSYMKRTGVIDSMFSATNPDIRKFQANGGKLLAFYGWSDPVGGSRTIMDYYDTVERVSGGPETTADFFRLFMVPGMAHCRGGEGASVFDFVGTIDAWVQDGTPPAGITGYHPDADGKPEFTRTVLPYRSANAR